jgi:UDP-N-acetyl-D-glucosamine dehydrogenase
MSIGIVGLGYVGLPLAVAFAEAGQHGVGVDADACERPAVSAPFFAIAQSGTP